MSGRALVRCQCPTSTTQLRACGRTATAEDFRCDVCRIGCRRTWVTIGDTDIQIPHASSPAAAYRTRFGTPPRR
ncbi:hypothetical protein [Streptosporangium roseum]|uniref:hypothetical protein n=1 Tax=Streptosporangium roseum TaxID=2001 RepID=UPI0012DE5DA0|nr:hypothetical protein [Streptosporangium roseum]